MVEAPVSRMIGDPVSPTMTIRLASVAAFPAESDTL